MDRVAHMFNCCATTYDQTVFKIRKLASSFGIHSHQVQLLPDGFHQIIHVEVLLARNDDRVRLTCQPVHLLHCDLVNLVVALIIESYQSGLSIESPFMTYVDALDVSPVAQNHINKLVDRDIFTNDDISVEDFYWWFALTYIHLIHSSQAVLLTVIVQNVVDHLGIEVV